MQIAPKIPPSTPTLNHLENLEHLSIPPRKSLPTPTLDPLENLGHLSTPPPKSLPPPILEYLETLEHLSPPPPTLLPPTNSRVPRISRTPPHHPLTPSPTATKREGRNDLLLKSSLPPKKISLTLKAQTHRFN